MIIDTYRAAYWQSDNGQLDLIMTFEEDQQLASDELLQKAKSLAEEMEIEGGRFYIYTPADSSNVHIFAPEDSIHG